jgi:hypothetical protein
VIKPTLTKLHVAAYVGSMLFCVLCLVGLVMHRPAAGSLAIWLVISLTALLMGLFIGFTLLWYLVAFDRVVVTPTCLHVFHRRLGSVRRRSYRVRGSVLVDHIGLQEDPTKSYEIDMVGLQSKHTVMQRHGIAIYMKDAQIRLGKATNGAQAERLAMETCEAIRSLGHSCELFGLAAECHAPEEETSM